LDLTIELVKISGLADTIEIQGLVLQDLVLVGFEQLVHVVAHGLEVHVQTEICALDADAGEFEIPRVGDYDGRRKETIITFFAEVLEFKRTPISAQG